MVENHLVVDGFVGGYNKWVFHGEGSSARNTPHPINDDEGPSSPRNDIDVYLQPLIAELKELWEPGIETYDAETNQTFQMCAALMWTRFLPHDHPLRKDKKSFDGKEGHKSAPTPLLGVELLEELNEFNNVFGKEASIVEGVVGRDCLNRSSRYLHDGVKTRFSRYQTEKEECNQNLSPIFPKIGHPIGREKRKHCTFLMDSELCHEAHRYALFNTGDEQVENLIDKDDPFVLASQVYQVFNVADPIEKDVYYARNKVPVDLYDLEEDNCPNIGDTFWREPNDDIGSTTRLDKGDFRWSREDVAVDIVDIPCNAQHSEDTIVETSEEEEDVDGTDWDWMEEDD
ncbi:hypothetical protein MTR67_017860 [Solanum verrucosum]|uniref:Uncharacterized protein n=1 Tax=Solanum verrucosum TaxID=315347 RepID=A0AAF0TSL0_SOLVR|nr:hypothetical protein MTR67_017860 [Solanum verrucosum]